MVGGIHRPIEWHHFSTSHCPSQRPISLTCQAHGVVESVTIVHGFSCTGIQMHNLYQLQRKGRSPSSWPAKPGVGPWVGVVTYHQQAWRNDAPAVCSVCRGSDRQASPLTCHTLSLQHITWLITYHEMMPAIFCPRYHQQLLSLIRCHFLCWSCWTRKLTGSLRGGVSISLIFSSWTSSHHQS